MEIDESFCGSGSWPKSYLLILKFVEKCEKNETVRESLYTVIIDQLFVLEAQTRFSTAFLVPLMLLYGLMIVIGALGSGLVIYAVLHSAALRTPRNMFILNLAITDLVLCVFTQPFNIIRLMAAHRRWEFGDLMCKLVGLFTATNVCVSIISITAIAIDRYNVIIHPTRTALKFAGAVRCMFLIWLVALILGAPAVAFSRVERLEIGRRFLQSKCTEHTAESYMEKFKAIYSLGSLFLIYILPLTIVILTYAKIYLRIRHRLKYGIGSSSVHSQQQPIADNTNNNNKKNNNNNNNKNTSSIINNSKDRSDSAVNIKSAPVILNQKQKNDLRRHKKANILLLSITIVFAVSWLPVNLNNIVMDFFLLNKGTTSSYTSQAHVIQAICLMMVLTSSCTNPFLYGWLNDNFREEFKSIFNIIRRRKRRPNILCNVERTQVI